MKGRTRFNISTVIDQFAAVNNSILVNDGDKSMYGTAIPYLYNLYSDLIVNPSTVSISEFQKMAYTMPVIAASLTVLKNLITNEIGPYQHQNPKYADFINNMLKKMDRSLISIVEDMCTALWAGFYIGEKKYVSDGRYIYVKDIQPRPAQSIIFRVDSQGKLKDDGIVQYYFNNLWTGYANLLAFNAVGPYGQRPNPYASLGDFDYPWRTVWAQPVGTVIIPKEKCIHFAYKGIDGLDNPYGRSLLRSAYDSYIARAEMTRITRNAANFNANPIPTVVVDPNQTVTEDGKTAFDDIADQLSVLGDTGGGNNFLLLQGKLNESIWIDSLDSKANLEDIIKVNNYWDKMMLTALLFPSELAGLSDKGSYALGETQADLIGRNINAIAGAIKDTLIEQLVRPVLMHNFNEKDDFGAFEAPDNVSEDIALNMDKINTLTNLGFTLTQEVITAMLDMKSDSIESYQKPAQVNTDKPSLGNYGLESNFNRHDASKGGDK